MAPSVAMSSKNLRDVDFSQLVIKIEMFNKDILDDTTEKPQLLTVYSARK